MYDIAYCLNISTDLGLYELYHQIEFFNVTVTAISNSAYVNLELFYNVSILQPTKSVTTYQTMLANAVSSGKFTAYLQTTAAITPNATALLHAASSSVAYGKLIDYVLI